MFWQTRTLIRTACAAERKSGSHSADAAVSLPSLYFPAVQSFSIRLGKERRRNLQKNKKKKLEASAEIKSQVFTPPPFPLLSP